MARTVDPVRYEARRVAILDAADRLLREHGAHGLTINEVLLEAGISKGTLYHYFSGKDDLLAALITRRLDAWSEAVTKAVNTREGPTQRLISLLRAVISEKSPDLPLLISMLPTLQSDDGAALQARLQLAGQERFLPLLTEVIADGVSRQEFSSPSPSGSAAVVMSLLQEMASTISRGLTDIRDGRLSPEELHTRALAFAAAVPAVIAAPATGEDILHPGDLDVWIRAVAPSSSVGPTDPQHVETPA